MGKPIDWKENPLVPQEQRLAFQLLKDNGFTLPWIEKSSEIRQAIHLFRNLLTEEIKQLSAEGKTPLDMQKWTGKVEQINRMIIEYNRGVPLDRFQINPLNLRNEMARANSINQEPC